MLELFRNLRHSMRSIYKTLINALPIAEIALSLKVCEVCNNSAEIVLKFDYVGAF